MSACDNAPKEDLKMGCRDHCPLNCFLIRLLGAIGTFSILLLTLVTAIRILDRFDIMHRCLLDFKPYASSLPWIIVIVFTTILLCIPSVTSEIKNLLDRLESFKDLKFRSTRDPEIREEAEREIEEKDGEQSHDVKWQLLLKKIEEIQKRKRSIVKRHAEQIQVKLVSRNIGIQGCDLHFDARYKDGRKEVLAKVFPLSSSAIESFCSEFDSLTDRFIAEDFVLHILVYFKNSLPDAEKRNGISKILWMASQLDLVKPYFYSISEDNSVTSVEDIP